MKCKYCEEKGFKNQKSLSNHEREHNPDRQIILTEQELWGFVYKEICNVSGISKVGFVLSKEYDGFKRRFNYFLKNGDKRNG